MRDNLGSGVFRQESGGYYFGVRSNPGEVATVQAGSSPSRSRKPREWPVHPKPDIHHRLPERRLCPKACHSSAALGRSRTDESVCPELESVRRALSVREWVSALKVGHSQIRIMVLPIRRNRVLQRSNPVPATNLTCNTSKGTPAEAFCVSAPAHSDSIDASSPRRSMVRGTLPTTSVALLLACTAITAVGVDEVDATSWHDSGLGFVRCLTRKCTVPRPASRYRRRNLSR